MNEWNTCTTSQSARKLLKYHKHISDVGGRGWWGINDVSQNKSPLWGGANHILIKDDEDQKYVNDGITSWRPAVCIKILDNTLFYLYIDPRALKDTVNDVPLYL